MYSISVILGLSTVVRSRRVGRDRMVKNQVWPCPHVQSNERFLLVKNSHRMNINYSHNL